MVAGLERENEGQFGRYLPRKQLTGDDRLCQSGDTRCPRMIVDEISTSLVRIIRHAAHHAEHASKRREELLLDGRLLFRGAGTHRPLAGRGRPPSWGSHGDIKQADWDALCDNRHPTTGEQLTATAADRSHGRLRFQFPRAQERVAALCDARSDERILDAFRDAVDGTMHDMEAEMPHACSKGGRNENRTTGNMAWGEFVHLTSRPVDGVPDPLLHAHCFVFNATFDAAEHRWKAGQFRDLKRDAPYFEAVFNSRFAHSLGELGLPLERNADGWELEDIDRSLVEKFSRRSKQIEEMAKEKGITNPDLKGELGAKTRERKQRELTFEELQGIWNERMTGDERQTLDRLAERLGGDAEPADPTAGARAIEYAKDHVFTRKSVVPERQLLAEALWHAVGQATPEEIHRQADESDLMVAHRYGRMMVTCPEVLDEEQRICDFAREGRGTCAPITASVTGFKDKELYDEQKQAVEKLAGSHDRLMVLRAPPASAKPA